MIYQGAAGYPVKEVILHTSATPGDWWKGKHVTQMRDAIDQWHKDRGWKGIGYHFVVAPDGTVARGRPVSEVGAHVKERNRGTIGICMVPFRTHHGIKTFSDYFTSAQRETVRKIIADLPGIDRVTGHNDYTSMKECPGFKVVSSEWLPSPTSTGFLSRIINWLRERLKR